MPVTISARVSQEVADLLRERAADEDRTVSDVVSRAIDEYLRSTRFPGVIFVTGADGRRKARLAGGPDVWEVVFTLQNHEMDVQRAAAHLRIPEPAARLALAYHRAYPAEADARLRRMAQLDADPERSFPGIRVVTIGGHLDAPSA